MTMQVLRQTTGALLKLDPHALLGAGGEAGVMPVPDEEELVAKVYRRPTESHARKLASMLANPPDDPMAKQGHVSIAWPLDLLRTPDANRWVIGFLMPRAPGRRPLLEFYNPGKRRQVCPLFSYQYLHRTARNLAAAVGAIHARGYVIGDVNESNILVTDTALVTLVDTDSFQVPDHQTGVVYRCPVGKPEFTPPELQGKTFRDIDRAPEHDLFGLAVLLFQLLMEGTHPYAGVYTGEGEPPPVEARIRAGHFPYGPGSTPYRPAPLAPPYVLLAPELRHLFERCFVTGHADPAARPSADLWVNALQLAENALVTCDASEQHRFGRHLSTCPWCERATRLRGRDPFPSREAVGQGLHLASAVPNQTALPSAGAGIPSRPVAATVSAAGVSPGASISPPTSPVASPPPRQATAPARASAQPSTMRPSPGVSPPPVAAPAEFEREVFSPWGAVALAIALGALALPQFHLWLGPLVLVLAVVGWFLTAGAAAASRGLALGALLVGMGVTGNAVYSQVIVRQQQERLARADRQRRAEVAAEVTAAERLVDEVTAGIERFKNEELTEREAEAIRESLRVKLETAVQHADRALARDPRSEQAWVQKARALRLSGDAGAARAAVNQGLMRFPESTGLKEQLTLLLE